MKKLSAVFAILFLLCAFRVSAEGDKARQLTLSGLDKKLTDGSEPAQDEQDAEAPASPDVPQEDAPSASD